MGYQMVPFRWFILVWDNERFGGSEVIQERIVSGAWWWRGGASCSDLEYDWMVGTVGRLHLQLTVRRRGEDDRTRSRPYGLPPLLVLLKKIMKLVYAQYQ